MGIPYAEVIGDPVAHSKSPLIHKFWLEKLGIAAEYRAVHVGAGELSGYFSERRRDPLWRGCNVTMPHKLTVLAHVDRLNPAARRMNAVNTIIRHEDQLEGLNTDWYGLSLALPRQAADGKDVVLVGAGGAARAAMEELRLARPRSLTILNRDDVKAARLLYDFRMEGTAHTLDAPLPPADLLINASPIGMSGFPPLELDLSPLRETAVVMDMVYQPLDTNLLIAARARDLTTVDGLSMLIWQAAMAFQFFFGTRPDEPETPELRALLTR